MSWASRGFAFYLSWGHEGGRWPRSNGLIQNVKAAKSWVEFPCPRKRAGPKTTKKGKRGYDRKREKTDILKEGAEDLE